MTTSTAVAKPHARAHTTYSKHSKHPHQPQHLKHSQQPLHPRTDQGTTAAPAVASPAPESTVPCPACGSPAIVEWRDMVAGTSGPVVHVKLRCPIGRHWFLMLDEDL